MAVLTSILDGIIYQKFKKLPVDVQLHTMTIRAPVGANNMKPKHLKGGMTPRVGHITFLDHVLQCPVIGGLIFLDPSSNPFWAQKSI